MKVRLKLQKQNKFYERITSFNSMKVRLKLLAS